MDLIKTGRGIEYLTQNAADEHAEYATYASELEGMGTILQLSTSIADETSQIIDATTEMWNAIKDEDETETGSRAGKLARSAQILAALAVHLSAASRLYLDCFPGSDK